MELHPQQHPMLEGRAGQVSLQCTVRGPALEVGMLYHGVTFYKFLNISEPIFPKSLRGANTIWAFYPFLAPSFLLDFGEIPSHSILTCRDSRSNNYNLSNRLTMPGP